MSKINVKKFRMWEGSHAPGAKWYPVKPDFTLADFARDNPDAPEYLAMLAKLKRGEVGFINLGAGGVNKFKRIR